MTGYGSTIKEQFILTSGLISPDLQSEFDGVQVCCSGAQVPTTQL